MGMVCVMRARSTVPPETLWARAGLGQDVGHLFIMAKSLAMEGMNAIR